MPQRSFSHAPLTPINFEALVQLGSQHRVKLRFGYVAQRAALHRRNDLVRVGGLQFGEPSLVQRNVDMMSRDSNTNNKRRSENLRK
jgi:hypothetical protein